MSTTRGLVVLIAAATLTLTTHAADIDDPLASKDSSGFETLPADARRVITGYMAAVNAGDAERALTYYAPEATLFLSNGRVVRGREALRQIEAFHAVVRPRQVPIGPSYRVAGTRTYVSFVRVRERSAIFTAIGMPFVTTERATDAFAIERGRIVAIRQPDFIVPCRAIMTQAMSAARDWLETRADSRFAMLMPGGVPLFDASTATTWTRAIGEWRVATRWEPDAAMGAACAGRPSDR